MAHLARKTISPLEGLCAKPVDVRKTETAKHAVLGRILGTSMPQSVVSSIYDRIKGGKGAAMPNEKAPDNPVPVGFKPAGGTSYIVLNGDDWRSIASAHDISVRSLIWFNFHTLNPDEINWYLRRNVGCNKMTVDGLNWVFSTDANPGIIYIPPHKGPRTPTKTQSFMRFRLETVFVTSYSLGGSHGDDVPEE